MRYLVCFVLFVPAFVLAEMKVLVAAMHGERMAVEYSVLNVGKHILTVKEKTGEVGGKSQFKRLQTIDLTMKDTEVLNLNYSFRCLDAGDKPVYAVLAKSRARKNGSFAPERAWSIDEKKLNLNPVSDPQSIRCVWWPEGESEYPF